MENIFVEFLPPWVLTGRQPAFYDKESGTVLQQTARMYDRVNMLIRMFNKLSKETKTVVEDYINQFNELHDYVQDYFDNLDVQEEINNKLNAMVEDGTLQEIITEYVQSNVAWTFDDVAEMKTATNLINGSYTMTLGFYSLNDGGGALYYITDSGTANEKDVIAVGDLYAHLVINREMDIRQFGAKLDGTDDSAVLSLALASDAEVVNISGDIEIDTQVTINSDNKYLKFYGGVDTTLKTCIFVIDSADNVTIDGAIFDFGSLNASNCIHVKDSNVKIENCIFRNIKNTIAESEKDIIRVYEGCKCNIENCRFENIKIVGNGTIGDNSGTGRCILAYTDVDATKTSNININNVSFKNCWNTDSNGEFIIEDFDDIHIAQSFNGQVNISNVFSSNAGKRVIKIQGNNVNIDNVEVTNTNDYESLSIISVMSNENVNINNVRFNGGNANQFIDFRRCTKANLTNVCGTLKNKTDPFTTASGHIIVTGATYVNIANCNISGLSYAFRVWETSNNINITNSYFECPHSIGQMTCRSESSATQSGVNIADITFENCTFKTSSTLNAHSLSIVPANEGTIKNIKFDKCRFVYTANTYHYGLMRINSTNSIMDNCEFISNASTDQIISNSDGDLTFIYSRITNDSAGSIKVSGNAKLCLDHCSTNNNIELSGTNCSLFSEYTTHGTISYASSATSAQLTELTY